MHDRIFQSPKDLAAPSLLRRARELELDVPRFEKCVASGQKAQIEGDASEAKRFGLSGTPAFLLGSFQADGSVRVTKKIIGSQPFATFKEAVDGLLAAK